MSEALFTDPNCTESERWSLWREALRRGRASLKPTDADSPAVGVDAAAEARRLGLGVQEAFADASTCFLGATAMLLSEVVAAWRGGRFVLAMQMFAMLHDQFLTNAHPGFSELSAWPLRDQDVRDWKERLLYQVRRFREKLGPGLARGFDDGFGEDAIPDAVERENLGSLASHVLRQMEQQRARRDRSEASPWWPENDDQAVDALPGDRLVPGWEMDAAASLVPGFSSSAPLISTVPTLRWDPPVRIFVYTELDVPSLGPVTRAPAFCHYRQWGMDVGFHDFFRSSPARTYNPDEADYFFVPSYACCHQVGGLSEFHDLDEHHAAVVQSLSHFARSGGRDHIFSFHYVDLFPSWRKHVPHSVFLTPETEVGFERSREEFDLDQSMFRPFSPTKDLSVPPYINVRDVLGFHRNSKPIQDREHLACFTGKLWGDITEAADVRGRLAALSGRPGLVIHAYPTISQMLGPQGMQSLMGNARFCFVPRGRAAWSVRFFESLLAGCVPVLLSDHYEPPFDALFDLTELVIKWPMSRIDDSLVDFLQSIPVPVVERYVAAAKRVRCWYLYPPPEVSWLGSWEARQDLEKVEEEVCPNLSSSRNAFHAVLEMLARRKRKTRAGGSNFYVPAPHTSFVPVITDADLNPI